MANCPDRQETLWLDVHEELDPTEVPAWEAHLAQCPDCREERARLIRTLRLTREATPAPELKPERARFLQTAIIRRLEEERAEPWWRKLMSGGLPRPAFAVAAACLVIMAVGFLVTWEYRSQGPVQTAMETRVVGKEDQATGENEILANLEILEEMDVLEKVVNLVDHKDVAI